MTGNAGETTEFREKVVELEGLIGEFVEELSQVHNSNDALLSKMRVLETSVSELRNDSTQEMEDREADRVAEEAILKGDLARLYTLTLPPSLVPHAPKQTI